MNNPVVFQFNISFIGFFFNVGKCILDNMGIDFEAWIICNFRWITDRLIAEELWLATYINECQILCNIPLLLPFKRNSVLQNSFSRIGLHNFMAKSFSVLFSFFSNTSGWYPTNSNLKRIVIWSSIQKVREVWLTYICAYIEKRSDSLVCVLLYSAFRAGNLASFKSERSI